MAETVIWHNPRCAKSRQALALLHARGIAPKVRLYQEDAPSEAEIRAALKALGLPAIALMRQGDALFRDIGLQPDMDDDRLVAAMVAYPAVIERPLVLHGGRAALGRPPERVLDLF